MEEVEDRRDVLDDMDEPRFDSICNCSRKDGPPAAPEHVLHLTIADAKQNGTYMERCVVLSRCGVVYLGLGRAIPAIAQRPASECHALRPPQ